MKADAGNPITKPTSKPIVITQAGLVHLLPLGSLFTRAVRAHFTYFPADIQERVIRQHNLFSLAKAAAHPRRIVLVARQGRRVVGYAIGHVPLDGIGQLYWLYVDPDCRGQNAGLSLLSRMLKLQARKGAREVWLVTYDHRHYYKRQGFVFKEYQLVDGVKMALMTFRLRAGE